MHKLHRPVSHLFIFAVAALLGIPVNVCLARDRAVTNSAWEIPPVELPKVHPLSGPPHHILDKLPALNKKINGRYAASSPKGETFLFTPLIELQEFLDELIKGIKSPHAAIVALQPHTGRILGISGKSNSFTSPTHSGFPAASLFKILTAAAAIYDNNITPETIVKFRGGNYTLNKYNFQPNPKYDKRAMSVADAMGKSCNPVFGRLALELKSPASLRDLALLFRFGVRLGCDFPLHTSRAVIPANHYELSRTGAGFGQVTISPVHAAALMAAIANKGKLPIPHIIHQILDKNGVPQRYTPPTPIQVLEPDVAAKLLKMTEQTTITGTAKPAFTNKNGKPLLRFGVAGKTGTLRGKNPKGLTKWFIAAAPLPEPRLVVAIVVMDPRYGKDRPIFIGKQIIERFFS